MTQRLVLLFALLGVLALRVEAQVGGARPRSLMAFRSDRELSDYLRDVVERRQRQMEAQLKRVRPAKDCGSVRAVRRGERRSAMGALIYGSVVDQSGAPIAGATVAIDSLGAGATTAEDGSFKLLPPRARLTRRQDWILRAKRIGFTPQELKVPIGPRDSVDVSITLCPSAVELESVVVSSMSAIADSDALSITNTQHAGVDEGGIVKVHGDHLVILRRGRLFTVRIGDELRPISMVNAFGPEIDPRGAWYDELLISGNKAVVVGYSYASHGTEIGIFQIDDDGELRYESTYHLRSNDYYSSRNYASRLLGTKLVFYTPQYLGFELKNPLSVLPAMRRWRGRADEGEFKRIISSTRVYRPPVDLHPYDIALHTVTMCDLAAPELECEATAVLGPSGRVFYVSPSAVYSWLTQWYGYGDSDSSLAMLYRMPLDGSSPKAVRVSGSPIDQFSFLESEDGHLNVLVRDDARGDAMWQAERTRGNVSLLRVPLEIFGDGRLTVSRFRYRSLPAPTGMVLINRFVGGHLLYGTGNSWRRPQTLESQLYVVPWRGGQVAEIPLPHGTDRIEVMGDDAVVVGTDGKDLHFSGISLEEQPEVALRYTMPNAAQGELRSHGFFYNPDGPDAGILGLPIRGGGKPGYLHLRKTSASILFLRKDDRHFTELGTLAADSVATLLDGCVASCVDWYGNSRPIFLRGRILALLGYELVEGRVEQDRIFEVRRVNFSPPFVRAVRR
jgi:hypothetical protein